MTGPTRLVDRHPSVPADRLVAELIPPPRFAPVRFDTYRPDPSQPTQGAAVAALRAFRSDVAARRFPDDTEVIDVDDDQLAGFVELIDGAR